MRTTLDLPDELFREVKMLAAEQGTTIKQLITSYVRAGLSGRIDSDQQARGKPMVPTIDNDLSIDGRSITNRDVDELLDADDHEMASRNGRR